MEDTDSVDVNPPQTPLMQRARENFSKISKSLKIAAAASIGFLSSGSAGRYAGEPMLYARVPGIEPIEIVRVVESELHAASPCYQIIDGQLVRQSFDLLPTESDKLLCFDRKEIKVPEGEGGMISRFISEDDKDISVPKALLDHLWEGIEPLKDLSPEPNKIREIQIGGFIVEGSGYRYDDPEDSPATITGQAIDKEGSIRVKLNEKVPVSERNMEMVVFHEAVHLAEAGNAEDDATFIEMFRTMRLRGEKNKEIFYAYRDNLPDYLTAKFTEGDYMNDHIPAFGSLFTLVDENMYISDGGGHPKDNARELFASCVVVLRYFPSSFMASVNELNAEDQQFMKGLAGHVVKFFNGSNEQIDYDRLQTLFAPELLEYLFPKE